MTVETTFDSTKQSLQDILKDIKSGKIQLPDFQRSWVWDDNHVKSLLASGNKRGLSPITRGAWEPGGRRVELI